VFRAAYVHRESFEFSTGYFFQTYSPTELDATFGAAPARLYVYNVVANFTGAILGFPEKGVLHVSLHAALLIPATVSTTAVVARYLTVQRRWKAMAPLVAIIPTNAVLGYTYVRARIMFVAGFAIAILLLHAFDDLLQRPQRVLGVPGRTACAIVVGLWLCVLVHTLLRLPLQAGAAT